MATPFATASDLALRLKRDVWTDPDDLAQVETFLEDASTDLRSEIGWQVFPPVEVTVEASPDWAGHIRLPGSPITEVTTVSQFGEALDADDYEWSGGLLHVYSYGLASVTYTVGYAEPPADLLKWTCVLAAQMLARAADDELGSTPASESLADWRVSYSKRQQEGELPIPDRVLERLRSTYGTSAYVTS